MSNVDELRDRLSVALGDSVEADRVWRRAMKHDARPGNEGSDGAGERQRLDALWRDREGTRRDVESLRTAVAEALEPGRLSFWFRTRGKRRG